MWIILLFISYLIGSIPFGLIISKLKGIDIRQHGSGNIGATNVWRTIGPIQGIMVLMLDASKGITGVYLGKSMGIEGFELLTALAAILGHAFPIFLVFRGGKIIATGLGVMLALSPISALIAVIIFSIVVLVSRYVSLGSVIAAVSVPISMLMVNHNSKYILFGILISIIAVYKHIPNLLKIIAGTENKVNLTTKNSRI